MSSEWLQTTVGEQATLQRGFDITKAEQKQGDVPVVSSAGITSWHDTAMVRGPGVVLGRKGVVGSVHFIKQNYWPHDTSLWVKDFHGNEPLYVYYFFRAISRKLNDLDVGSANPTLNRNHVHPIPIAWPSNKTEQREIAGMLGALDERITLLREINKTLESIAQAIFKSWFVDFDPVRAKIEGRQPEGMDEETASLFPDRFEELPLGTVPRGWQIRSLDNIARYLNGLALQKFPPTGHNDLPIIKIAQLRKGETDKNSLAAGTIKSDYVIQDGDVLFSWSGSLEVEIWCGGCGALNQHLFKVTSTEYPKWFYYLWTRHHLPSFRHIAESKATTMGHIQRKHLSEATAIVPCPRVLEQANEIFESLINQQIENALRARTLTALRDALLPRLISGQLRIPDAQEQVENALS